MTVPIVATAGVASLTAGLVVTHLPQPRTIYTHTVATTSPAPVPSAIPGATVTVIGNGTVTGTPDQVSMSFGVDVNGSTAASALSDESAQAQKLIDALHGAGVKDSDIQTEQVSLYLNQQTRQFNASSYVSAVIHGISHASSVIDAAVRATGDSITLNGISLSIGDTSSLMANARAAAVHDARTKAEQYASAAGLKLGSIVAISEVDTSPRPLPLEADAGALASSAQPIQPGRQSLQVSVTVVYGLTQ